MASSVKVLPIDVATPRPSYACNRREPATLLTLSQRSAEGGLKPLTAGSMGKRFPLSSPNTYKHQIH